MRPRSALQAVSHDKHWENCPNLLTLSEAFLHHGQLCFSTEKVIVLEPVAARFQDLLVEEAINFETGSGVSQRILDSSLEKLRDAKEKGACFLIGGPELASSVSLKPTILAGVTKEMSIYDEEAFGPSFSVFIAKNDREAIEMANATKYGLNAAVHSKDMKHALDVAREIDSGSIHVNSMTAHDERRSTFVKCRKDRR